MAVISVVDMVNKRFQKSQNKNYTIPQPNIMVNSSPCIEEANTSLFFSNLTNPLVNTPLKMLKVTKTVTILIQELNTLNCPYSSVVRIRVKIGVDIVLIPFCKNMHNINQIDALTYSEALLYFDNHLYNMT